MRIKEIENMIYNTRNQEAQTQVEVGDDLGVSVLNLNIV